MPLYWGYGGPNGLVGLDLTIVGSWHWVSTKVVLNDFMIGSQYTRATLYT
jgi:hypothetical protein